MNSRALTFSVLAAVLLSLVAFVVFGVVRELAKRRYREARQIPTDAEIVYFCESGFRDVTRFCLIQHPMTKDSRPPAPAYRAVLPGALGIMANVQRELAIPDAKMPDLKKKTMTYTGGENERRAEGWMFLDVADSETRQEWIFED